MEPNFEAKAEEIAAFQKIWMDSATKMFQTAFTSAPNSPPPEMGRQIRGAMFQALAQSWDEFMRSPQFLQATKEWMEQAISFRKLTNDMLGRVRNELQAPSKDDTDTVMLTIRHMEKRVLDRVEQLSRELNDLKAQISSGSPKRTEAKTKKARTRKVSL